MPKLLRLHFASIGHRDARLAPLSLDFRDNDGQAVDSALWLRNGGGKSSILNLLFSLLRPERREFLGATAEARARRLEDYVKASDLSFVLSEWDLTPPEQAGGLFAGNPQHTWIVGQMLAWKGGQRSVDASRLRRLFFSMRASPEARFDGLPVQGLGDEPVTSVEAFRDYLHEVHAKVPGSEVVTEEAVRRWSAHLSRLRLDPELFHYQIKMNQREGAADELFRFRSARDFVHFLLELATEPSRADRVAENLSQLRDQLRRRPALVLEQTFLQSLEGRLGPLSQAVASLEELNRAHDEARSSAASASVALAQTADALAHRAASDDAAGQEAEQRAREIQNEQRTLQRWAEGLERHARKLELTAAQTALCSRQNEDAQAALRVAVASAAMCLHGKRRCDAEVNALHEALNAEEEELAPLREQLRKTAAMLHYALGRDIERIQTAFCQQKEELRVITERIARLEAEQGADREQLGACSARIEKLEEQVARRDRARERLRNLDVLERREEAKAAERRWQNSRQVLAAQQDAIADSMAQARDRLEALFDERKTLEVQQAELMASIEACDKELSEAVRLRDELETHPAVLEVEELERADAFAEGLGERLAHRADGAAKALLRLRVEGLEDERALASVLSSGLLPPSTDVEKVLGSLRARGVAAYSAYAYLSENVAEKTDRRKLICTDPAAYAGVVVADEHGLDAARELLDKPNDDDGTSSSDIGVLMGPVSVSTVTTDQLQVNDATSAAPQTAVVLPPSRDGLFDPAAAAAEQGRAEVRSSQRRRKQEDLATNQRELLSLGRDLSSFLTRFGAGRLEALGEAQQARKVELDVNTRRVAEVVAARDDQRERLEALGDEQKRVAEQLKLADRALQQLEHFIETHEQHYTTVRDVLVQARYEHQDIVSRLDARQNSLKAEHESRDKARDLLRRLQDDIDELRSEQQRIATRAEEIQEETDEKANLSLAEVRARYAGLHSRLDERLGNSRLQGQLDALERQQQHAALAYRKAAAGLVEEAITAALEQHGAALEQHIERCEAEREAARKAVARAEAHVDMTRQRLEELSHRREADDLPTDAPIPTTPEGCRSRALALRADAENAEAERARAAEEQATCREAAAKHARSAELRRQQRQLLLATTAELPDAAPTPLPEADDAVQDTVAALRQRFQSTAKDAEQARALAHRLADKVRDLGHDERFVEHKSQIRERLKAPSEELMQSAADYAARISERQQIIEENLRGIDRDREMLISAVMGLCDGACRLLERAGRASRLPSSLKGWAGRQFLQVAFAAPSSEDAKRARLMPLVDRLVTQARVPSGLELTQLAVDEIVGSEGYDVKVLKPDAVLRGDALPIVAMTNFSRGQQLTAAVLLYCTLARLRAINRGRAEQKAEGSVLILDNPIGTCSSVPLLNLQRVVARAMDIQLIYTTGVHDLEALSTLPNIIRLRNTHRERRSGDYHVTAEEGTLESVRIAVVGQEDDAA